MKAINTACYVLNRSLIRPILKKTSYELYEKKKLDISYFKIFGCHYFILINDKEKLDQLNAKSDEGIFLDYSSSTKAYKVFNRRTLVIEESIYIVFNKTHIFKSREVKVDDDIGIFEKEMKEMSLEDSPSQNQKDKEQEQEDEIEKMHEFPSSSQQDTHDLSKEQRYTHSHPKELIIDDASQGIRTRD